MAFSINPWLIAGELIRAAKKTLRRKEEKHMNKKLICLTLALVMLCMATLALATSSKTGDDMIYVSYVGYEDDDAGAGTCTEHFNLLKETTIQRALIKAISAKKYPADYFGRAGVAAVLPAGFNLNKLVMNELHVYTLCDCALGNLTLTFVFPTEYKVGTAVVVMFGIVGADGVSVEWTALKGEVVAGGGVRVTIPAELLAKASKYKVVIAILSEV